MQFPNPFFRFLLEFRGVRRKVGVFVSEKLVGNFARKNNADVAPFVNRLANQVHADTCANRRNIERSEQPNDPVEGRDNVVRRHIDFRVIAANVVGDLPSVFQIDRVFRHADRVRFNRNGRFLRRDGAHERRVEPAREKEPDRRVGNEALFHAGDEFFPNIAARRFQSVAANLIRFFNLRIPDEFTGPIIAAGRERHNFFAQAYKVFRFAGEDNRT